MKIKAFAGGGIAYLPTTTGRRREAAQTASSSSSNTSKVPGFADKIIDMVKSEGIDSDVSNFLNKVSMTLDMASDPTGENLSMREILNLAREASLVTTNYKDYGKARESLDTEGAWGEVAINSHGQIYVFDNDTKKIKTVSVSDYKENSNKYIALNNEDLMTQRRSNPALAYNNTILDDLSGVVGMGSIIEDLQTTISKFQTTDITGFASKQGTDIKTGMENIINGILSNGNTLQGAIVAGPDGVYKISEKSTYADTHLKEALNYLIRQMPKAHIQMLTAKAAVEGYDPNALLLEMLAANTERTISATYEDTTTKASGMKGSSAGGNEALTTDTLANEFAKGDLSETTAFISPRATRVSDTAAMAIKAWNGGQMVTSEGKGIEMNNLAEIMPQVEQLKACNTSTVFFGNQRVDRQDIASIVWDGSSLIKRVALPVKYENGEMVPDFDLLIKVNEVNKWISENPGVTKMEINDKLKELQGAGVEFDEQTGQFKITNVGYFATFSGYASDDILDLKKSEAFIEKLPRSEGLKLKEAFNNYIRYGKSNPGKKEHVKNNYDTVGARSIYLGNIYIPLEDPIQGFLMTNKQIRPKDEFRNPSKLEEVSEMIQAGKQNSGWKTNFNN